MIKKLLTLSVGLSALLSVSAGDFPVYQNGALSEGLDVYGWYNDKADFAADDPDSGSNKVFRFEASGNAGYKDASMGIYLPATTSNTGYLHNANLNFKWYVNKKGATYTIRLESTSGSTEDKKIELGEDETNCEGMWHSASWNIAEMFPKISKEWNDNVNNGGGYIFSIIISDASEGDFICFKDVVYTDLDESWVPVERVIPAPSTVPDFSCTFDNLPFYTATGDNNVSFNHGGWGQATGVERKQIDGKNVYAMTNFNYEGWVDFDIDISNYTHMHVDYWTPDGTNLQFVPISLPAEGGAVDTPVWTAPTVKQNEWNSYDAPLSSFNAALDRQHIKQIKFDNGYDSRTIGYIANVYFYKDENAGTEEPETPEVPEQAGNTYSGIIDDIYTQNREGVDYYYPYECEYSITYLEDKKLDIYGKLTWGEAGRPTGGIDIMYVDINGQEQAGNINIAGSTLTSNNPYEPGTEVTIKFRNNTAGPTVTIEFPYVVGSQGEATSIRVKASAENVTYNSADIAYTVTAPEGSQYQVYYKTADTEAQVASENPIKLTELQENTDYAYEVYAVLQGDEAVESTHVTVTFKTPRKDAVELVYNDIFNAQFTNAFLPNESNDQRRTFYAAIPWSVTYHIDGTATYTANFSNVPNIVGLNPQIWVDGIGTVPLNTTGDNIWTYDLGARQEDASAAISHYFAYDGGVVDSRTPYTSWGMVKDAPKIGEAVNVKVSASKTYVKIEEPIYLSAVGTDANGYYVPASELSYKVDGESGTYHLDGSVLTLLKVKGPRTVTAYMGDASATVEVFAMASPEAANVLAGKKAYTDEKYVDGDVNAALTNVTDENRESQLVWLCNETEEHYLIYELDQNYYIEAIDLLFEGAYATEFTVTLTNTRPAEIDNGRAAVAETNDDVVFSPASNNTQHYFAQLPATTHKYVVLRTSKASNTSYGIKVRDFKVYATTALPSIETGVETIVSDSENAPVEYYNLNGIRVNNPENGIFIRRQGSNVSKVIIR